jgi:hypothetical protein
MATYLVSLLDKATPFWPAFNFLCSHCLTHIVLTVFQILDSIPHVIHQLQADFTYLQFFSPEEPFVTHNQ